MHQISAWTSNIVVSVMIVTLLEMLLPEGKSKKYIQVILSIYLLFTILFPVAEMLKGKEKSLEVINLISTMWQEEPNNTGSLIETDHSVKTLYEANLKQDIKNQLEQKGYKVNSVLVQFEQNDTDNYGKIQEISVEVKQKDNKKTNTEMAKKEEITIHIHPQTDAKKDSISESEKEEIKQFLNQNYGTERVFIQ